jgi:hypothetical protein
MIFDHYLEDTKWSQEFVSPNADVYICTHYLEDTKWSQEFVSPNADVYICTEWWGFLYCIQVMMDQNTDWWTQEICKSLVESDATQPVIDKYSMAQ